MRNDTDTGCLKQSYCTKAVTMLNSGNTVELLLGWHSGFRIAWTSIVIGSRVKHGQSGRDFNSRGMFAGDFMDLSLETTRSQCSRLYNASIWFQIRLPLRPSFLISEHVHVSLQDLATAKFLRFLGWLNDMDIYAAPIAAGSASWIAFCT